MGMDNVKSRRGKKAEPPGPSAIRKRKLSLFKKLGLELSKDPRPSAAVQAITTQAWVDVVHFDKAMESRDLGRLREAVQLRGRGPLGEPSEPTVELYKFLDKERQKREEQFISVLRDRLIPKDRWNRPEQALDHVNLLLDIPGLSSNQVNAFQLLRQELEATPAPPQSLPLMRSLPEIIGRTAEVEAVQRQLQTPGLVTLIGTGGIGKTRLALAVAGQPGAEVPHGVRFIDLTAVTGALLPQAVGQGLGLREEKGYVWEKMVLAHLQDKALLLVWDNCEQLAGDCANLAREIITHCPSVRLLATSREPLGTSGEREYLVPVLPLPAPDDPRTPEVVLGHDATRLFSARAQAVRSDFRVTEENSAAIFRICQGLDGLPLAIELAAALVEEYEPAWIADRLDECFGLLVDGPRAGSLRHTSLRAAFDLSYGLLNRAEQKLFRHLGVFPGSFGTEAVEAVSTTETIPAPDVARLLPQLVRKSLVMAEQHGNETRYRLLVTVRQYAQDRLRERGEWKEMRRRHRDYFLALAEEAEPLLRGPKQKHWLDRLETEHDNFRAALAWRLDEASLCLACALQRFWWVRGYLEEGRRWLERDVEDNVNVSEEMRAGVLLRIGRLAQAQGDIANARKLYEESLAIRHSAADSQGIADTLNSLANATLFSGDYEEAEEKYLECQARFRALDDKCGLADALFGLGMVATNRQKYEEGEKYYQQSLALWRETESTSDMATLLMALGNIAHLQGRYEDARTLLEEGLSLNLQLGNKISIASAFTHLGRVAMAQGDYGEAHRLFNQGLALARRIDHAWGMADALNDLGSLAYLQNDYEQAQKWIEQSLVQMQKVGNQRIVASILSNLAGIALAQEKPQEANILFEECLRQFRALQERQWIANALIQMAGIEAFQEKNEKAAVLMGAAEAILEQLGYQRPPSETGRYDEAVSETRAALSEAQFAAAWEEGRAMSWEQAVAFALGEDAP